MTNCIFNSINSTGCSHGFTCVPFIANIYMEHFESLAIPTSPKSIKWWFRYVDNVLSTIRKDQANKLQEHLISIDPHIKFTIELQGTDGLPFLDTVTKPTPNSIESTVYRKPTHTDRYLDYNSNHPISANLSLIDTLIHRAKQFLHLTFFKKKWIIFIKFHKTTTTQHSSFNKPNPNRKPNPSTVKFIEGAWVVIPYMKGLSEQYRHILTKYRVRVFFKGTSTIKSLLMHPKDPIPDAPKNWHNLPLEMPNQQLHSWIHRWNQQVPERKEFQTIDIKPPEPSETITSPQNTQKQNLKHFTIIDRDSNTLHHWVNEALQIHIKDSSLNRNIGKVRIPSVFYQLLKCHTQLELPHSSIPHPKLCTFFTWPFNTKDIWCFTPSWSPSTIEVSSLCSHLSNFKTTESLDLHLQRNT